jgi:SAM-dependent methyltransferase
MMGHGSFSSSAYWQARCHAGGTSGASSYVRLATFKAAFINAFIADNLIHNVLDLGCGDGNLLSLLDIPSYVGVDVSPTTLMRCASRFGARSNYVFLPPAQLDEVAPVDLAMSIDVIFPLIEDVAFGRHIDDLFGHAKRFVVIYTSNHDSAWSAPCTPSALQRPVAVRWPTWHLLAHVPNRFPYDPTRPDDTSFADFFVYGRTTEPFVIRVPAV